MGLASERRQGLVRSIQAVCAGVIEGLGYRLELFAIEFREEKDRAYRMILGLLLVAFCAFTGFLCLNFLLLVSFWDYRVQLSALLGVLYLLLALLLGLRLRRKFIAAPKPFAATLAELEKDRQLGSSAE